MRASEKGWGEEEGAGRGLFQGWVSGESQVGGLLVEEWAKKLGVCQVGSLIVEVTTCRLDHLLLFLSRRDVAPLLLVFVGQIVI